MPAGGPDKELYRTSQHQVIENLASQLPQGVTPTDGQVVVVEQGTVVLQAANPSAEQQTQLSSPQAQFFVLRDNVTLRGSDLTNPQQSTDSTGSPAVKFGFNRAGARAFQNLTGQIAHRGQDVSTLDQTLNHHFAVALDNQLIIVAPIDYKIYPDGVTSGPTHQFSTDSPRPPTLTKNIESPSAGTPSSLTRVSSQPSANPRPPTRSPRAQSQRFRIVAHGAPVARLPLRLIPPAEEKPDRGRRPTPNVAGGS